MNNNSLLIDKRLHITPTWIIFIIDLAIILSSVFMSMLLRFNFDLHGISIEQAIKMGGYVSLVSSSIFFLLRPYAGIIRHTTIKDGFKVLQTVTAISVIFLLTNFYLTYKGLPHLIPNSVILINIAGSFLPMFIYRILAKELIAYLVPSKKKKNNTFILGAGEAGIIAKRAIDADSRSAFRIVGFLDDNNQKIKKKLLNVPIYSALEDESLEKLILNLNITHIIIATQLISPERESQFVDWCLEIGVKVLTVPPISEWVNGNFTSQQLKTIKIEDLLNRKTIKIHNEEINEQLTGKVILVSGAAGSIGSELVRQLAKFKPSLIIALDQSETPLHELELETQALPNVKIKCVLADIRRKSRIERIFGNYQPDYVFHAAAYKHVPMMERYPNAAILNNVMGSINLAELSATFGVEKFVMVSTDKAVNPTNVMGASKRIAEIYIQSLNNSLRTDSKLDDLLPPLSSTKFITTRFGNVLGSNGSVIPRFKQQIDRGGPITVTHPEITRYFMTIPEACQLVLEAGTMGTGGEIFVFDMGEPVKIVDLARKMIKLYGLKPNEDIQIVFSGLRPGEKLYEELLSNKENTLPTYHEKIMIAKVKDYSFALISEKINDLIQKTLNGSSDEEIVALMKQIVPEFKSENSVFEKLDHKVHEAKKVITEIQA